jgi:hypothetical protein
MIVIDKEGKDHVQIEEKGLCYTCPDVKRLSNQGFKSSAFVVSSNQKSQEPLKINSANPFPKSPSRGLGWMGY